MSSTGELSYQQLNPTATCATCACDETMNDEAVKARRLDRTLPRRWKSWPALREDLGVWRGSIIRGLLRPLCTPGLFFRNWVGRGGFFLLQKFPLFFRNVISFVFTKFHLYSRAIYNYFGGWYLHCSNVGLRAYLELTYKLNAKHLFHLFEKQQPIVYR